MLLTEIFVSNQVKAKQKQANKKQPGKVYALAGITLTGGSKPALYPEISQGRKKGVKGWDLPMKERKTSTYLMSMAQHALNPLGGRGT